MKKEIVTPEQKQKMLDEARVFFIAAPTILPLIKRKRESAVNNLIGAYRGGAADYVGYAAEISVLDSLEKEINMQNTIYETLMEDGNGTTRN